MPISEFTDIDTDNKSPSELPKQDKLTWAKKLYHHTCASDYDSHKEMKEDFAFAAGDQWTEDDKRALEEQGRPCLTFNFLKPYIDVVGGLAEQNKTRARAMPIETTDQFLCDVLNDIGYWVYESTGIEEDETDAFENGATCGKGMVALDIIADPKRFGEIRFATESPFPCEVHVAPAARKNTWADAPYIFWDRWYTKEDFKIAYPKHADDIEDFMATNRTEPSFSNSSESSSVYDTFDSDDEDDKDYRTNGLDLDYYDRRRGYIRVVHMEYWESYDRYYGFNPLSGQIEEFTKDNLKLLKKRIPDFQYTTIKDKKIKWLQFIKDKILYEGDSEIPFDGYSIIPITAYKDKRAGLISYYGIVRLLKDPQREINKRWSQALNLLNNQVQGGVFAEADAFLDKNQAEDSMRESGAITWVKKGAIREGKIQEKHIPTFPDAPIKMQELSNQALRFISGINPDLLGHDRGRQEPGVVVRMRQQQGLTILTKLFKSYDAAKRMIFERILSCVVKYMPDSQIMRILGEGEKYIIQDGVVINKESGLQANIRDLRNIEYNVTVQSAPGNMTKIMLELATLMEMASSGLPVDPKLIIAKLDLPADEKNALYQYIEAQQKAQSEAYQQEQQAKYGIEQAKLQQKAQQMQTKTQLDLMKLKQKQEESQIQSRVERVNKIDEVSQMEKDSQRKHVVDLAKLEHDKRELVINLIAQLQSQQTQQAARQ